MPPTRGKGQSLNVFHKEDDITDLSIQHNRDGRVSLQGRMKRNNDDDTGGGYNRNERRRDTHATDLDVENWRRPAGTKSVEVRMESMRSDRNRSNVEPDFAAPWRPKATSTNKKFDFGRVTETLQTSGVEKGKIPESKERGSLHEPLPTQTFGQSKLKGNRFVALKEDEGHTKMNNTRSLGIKNSSRTNIDSSQLSCFEEANKAAALERQTELHREKILREREELLEREKAERLQREEEARKIAAEKALVEAEAKRKAEEEERKARDLREAEERQIRAQAARLRRGEFLQGSHNDVVFLTELFGPVFEGKVASKELIAEVPESLFTSSVPIACIFALYFKQLLNVCEIIADNYQESQHIADIVVQTVLPVATKACNPCRELLRDFEAVFEPRQHWSTIKMQELSRIAAGTGLHRLSYEHQMTTVAYEAMLKNGVFTEEEFLQWIDKKDDECELRIDTITRVIKLAKKLKGESDKVGSWEDEEDFDEEEEDY